MAKFSVTLVGKFADNVTMTWAYEDESTDTAEEGYRYAAGVVRSAYERFVRDELPSLLHQSLEARPSTMAQTVLIRGGRIIRTMDKGKTLFKLSAGDWIKWGVPIYEAMPEEILKAMNEGFKSELTLSDQWVSVVKVKADGKPDKVMSMERIPNGR